MIAKRITSKAAKPRMARLVRYVVAAEGGLDPRSWQRTADYMLCSKTNNRGEKVGGVRVTNCHTDDPAAATTLIEVTQAANTRSKTDKTYHLVFSFPPGEQPSLEVLHKIEDELCAAIGFADHQRISAVHIDTDHLHVHVAINKVHPKGLQNIEPYYDKKKLMEACERLELEFGLIRTNHGLTGERKREKDHKKLLKDHKKHNGIHSDQTHDGTGPNKWSESSKNISASTMPKGKAADLEAHSGIESIQGFVSRELAPRLKEAKSWKEAREVLAEHGLEIKLRGAGLVIGSGKVWVKASQCDRGLSFKAMTDRMGPFEQSVPPARPYEPKPKQNHREAHALYEAYLKERETRFSERQKRLNKLRQDKEAAAINMKLWATVQRATIKSTMKGPSRRAALALIRAQYASMRQDAYSSINDRKAQIRINGGRVESWPDWLARQAKAGNEDALAVLRHRKDHFINGNVLSGVNGRNIVLSDPVPHIDDHGRAVYNTRDGGMVIDRKDQIQSLKTTSGATLAAISLAEKRFAGQRLTVAGQDHFKREVAQLAGLYQLNVRFGDAEMERIRLSLAKTKTKHRGMEP